VREKVTRVRLAHRLGRPLAGAVLLSALAVAAASLADDTGGSSAGSNTGVVSGFFRRWLAMVAKTQSEQPHWITPLITVTPRLEQELRYDQLWQSRPEGQRLTSYGGGKGLEIIPTEQTEVILGIPAWLSRNHPEDTDGWADETFLLKYRVISANEASGNYILTLFMGFSAPTGTKSNSMDHATYSPTIAFGKGWGDFDVQGTLGATLPDNAPGSLGTPILANLAFQYHVTGYFWPEVEANYTYWPNGDRIGKNQLFITPGLVVGRIPLWERLGLTVGGGFQVAVTRGPVYHNSAVFSVRLPF
jgi:hypothetical protein